MEGGKLPTNEPSTDVQDDQYVLPPTVADLPSAMLRQYILVALHTPFDKSRHTAASSGVDFLVYCRAVRTPEFLKLMAKLIPQMTVDSEPRPPITFKLQVPIKSLDMMDEETLQKQVLSNQDPIHPPIRG